jgi:hypothetical protein
MYAKTSSRARTMDEGRKIEKAFVVRAPKKSKMPKKLSLTQRVLLPLKKILAPVTLLYYI